MRAVQKSYQHPRFKERAKGEFINYAGKDTLIYQALGLRRAYKPIKEVT
ncbi:hypothetical protein [Helicobacter sp. 10-6591]|nr:hypothetical protein [Helicobacter sp. 10-6591]